MLLLLLLFQGLGPEDGHDEGDCHAHRTDDDRQHQAADEGAQPVQPDDAGAPNPEHETREEALATHRNGVDELVVIGVRQSHLPSCGGLGSVWMRDWAHPVQELA